MMRRQVMTTLGNHRMRLMCALFLLAASFAAQAERSPNVVLILSDDAGFADFSFQGSRSMRTPHIDSIAAEGVRFAQGYVSASVCSPSRAGLITGRYQQRFGHEHNFPAKSEDHVGLPLSERTLADALGGAGYHTIAMGKWHLGYGAQLHPGKRGFDDFYGFLQGSRSYRPHEGTPRNRLQRNGEYLLESFDYMTDHLGAEAVRYIETCKDKPFFLYLSFNAVHSPMQALRSDLKQVVGETVPKRKKLAAMTASMDRAVGLVLAALEEQRLEKDTLVIFVNDNGGAWNNAANNAPLRGTKGTPFEGGLRVPFLMRWPGVLPAGTTYEHPVSTLDIFATALAAAGGKRPEKRPLDGVDLVPFVRGENDAQAHEALFWRRKQNHAARVGDWKLVVYKGSDPMLFNIASDMKEETDLAATNPQIVARLSKRYASWEAEMIDPLWGSSAVDPKD